MSQRLLRVRELLKREIGTIISRDYSFDALVTINEVDVTPDLRKGHVYLGIIGGAGGEQSIISRLNRERGNIQRRLAKRVVLKFTPQLSFKADASVERGVRTISILEELDGEDSAQGTGELDACREGEEPNRDDCGPEFREEEGNA
ncbi:MAG: 30S ribosome-binding factor RbfA [Verrucomicrobiales bacterium]|nr:30S ribosome-binding factor RbfA [Verrucomicrobiales bacterium]